MTASSLPAEKVYSYGEKPLNIRKLEEEIKNEEKKIADLEQQMKEDPKRKKNNIIEKASQEVKLNSLKDELIEAEYEIEAKKIKYFVPSK